jgi:pentatricopeptide repeat protein
VEPDDVVFAVLVRGYGVQSNPPDWIAIARLLTRMQTEFNVPMSVSVYNALLEVCVMSGDVSRAEDLLDKMDSQGFKPDEYTERVMEGKRAFRSALRRTFSN